MSTGLAVLAVAALGALSWYSWALPATTLQPDEAAAHEGHAGVVVEGQVQHVQVSGESTRFELHGGGAWMEVRVAAMVPVREGDHIAARGLVGRQAGVLTLFVASAADCWITEPAAGPISLATLANDPAAWQDRILQVNGTLKANVLRDGDGHALQILGPRLQDGRVTMQGVLGYASSCLCYALRPLSAPSA